LLPLDADDDLVVVFFLRLGFFAFVPAPVALVTVFALLLVPLGFLVVVVDVAGAVAGAVAVAVAVAVVVAVVVGAADAGAIDAGAIDGGAVDTAGALGAEVSMGAAVEAPALPPAAGIGAVAGAIIQTQRTEYSQGFLVSERLLMQKGFVHAINNKIKRGKVKFKVLYCICHTLSTYFTKLLHPSSN
jgi:hypothetical protein